MVTKEEYLSFLNKYEINYYKIKHTEYYISLVKKINSNNIQINLNQLNRMIFVFNDEYYHITDIKQIPKHILKVLNVSKRLSKLKSLNYV